MKRYAKVDIAEQQLEDVVRQSAGMIEEGLVYVDHQKAAAGGRLDVLMVDSGKSLVVAELKIVQDDGMLLQGLDYYDYAATHIESFARLYKAHSIDPTQQVRLFLIAPSFSQTLINRCKWLDLPVSLFMVNCLRIDGDSDVVAIFSEQEITTSTPVVEVTHLEEHLDYITDAAVRSKVVSLIDEFKSWKPGNVSIDPIKYAISLKVNGRVFARIHPRRKHYLLSTFDADEEWKVYPVKSDDDLANVKPIVRATMERKIQ